MSDRPQPLHIRIFISSPGDVTDERSIALQVLERIQYDPLLRGQITVEAVAWDKPGADTPMLATMTPQEAINLGLPTPAVCDIVVVIFWSRMGTPLPDDYTRPDGSRYLSGTAWEYENAVQASRENNRPLVVVYRRMQDVNFNPRDSQFARKLEQWERVEAFFAGFVNPDGSIRQGYNPYQTPDDFREKFETHLKSLIKRLLDETPPAGAVAKQEAAQLWKGSPFPGLRAFTSADAPIFFGRGAETDALLQRLSDPACRLAAVVGASGSGKSSLVGAGLIPRLAANAIEGSRDWTTIRFTPGELASGDPFEALAVALARDLPGLRGTPARDLTHRLHEQAESLGEIAQKGLSERPLWAELVLFIDQFEELFSLVRPPHVAPFIDLLAEAASTPRVRIVITLRADFYAKCVEYPRLAELLKTTTYPLAAPEIGALYEMIARPADLAGLTFEDGLVNRVLDDTGTEPGTLALMAYALDELYRACELPKRLTHAAYQALGGVQGAIGERAESTFAELDSDSRASLPDVFREIAEVDERGVAIRRRANVSRVARTDAARRLVEALTDARLLVQSRDEDGQPVVEVAHEALLRSWARLARWIEDTQDDLRLLRQVRLGADYWENERRSTADLLAGTRLERARVWLQTEGLTPLEREFLEASAAEETRRQQAAQDAQTRELEMQREIAEKRRQSANRLRYLAGVMAVFLVVTLMLSLFAFDQRNAARKAATTAENSAASLRSLALVTSAEQALSESDPALAVALAVQANRLENPPADAVRVLYEAAYAPYAIREFESNGYIDVALSPDGKTALGYFSGQEEGLYLWDMASGERLRSAALDIPEITGFGVSDLAVSADGRRAAFIGFGGLVVVWDIENWQQIAVLNPEVAVDYVTVEQDGFGVAINDDGSQVLAGVFGALIRWDVDSGEVAQLYTSQTADQNPFLPQLVEWSPDGHLAFIASINGSEAGLLIDLETGEIIQSLYFVEPNPTRRIAGYTSAAFSADGKQIITGYDYYGAIIWDVAGGMVVAELLNAGRESVGAVTVSPDGQYYAVANGANIEVWTISLSKNEPIHLTTLPQPDLANLTSLDFRPDNQTLLAAYQSDELTQLFLPALVLWRVASDAELPSFPIPASIMAVSPDGCCGLYISAQDELHEIDLNTGDLLHTLENAAATNVIYSGDGSRVLISRGENEQVLLWNLETNTAVAALLMEAPPVISMAASPDGRFFAVEEADQSIDLFTKDGEIIHYLDGLSDMPVTRMMFSADSEHLLATTTDFLEDLIVWDVTSGTREIRTPNFDNLESTSINFRGINAQSYLLPDGEDLLIAPDGSDMLRLNTITGAIETIYADSNRDIFQIVMNEQVIVATLCVEQVQFACNQSGLRIWDTVTGSQLAEILVDKYLDGLQLGKTAILAQEGDSLYRYRLEMPLQLMERLEQEGRIRPFTLDECRRFALDCAP